MIECPRCHHENPEGALICKVCGSNLGQLQGVVSTKKLRQAGDELGFQATLGAAYFGPDNQLVLYIPSASQTITLVPSLRVVLGRLDKSSPKAPDLDLGPYDAFNKGVSRLHAAIIREDGEALAIVDLGSVNHTYLNGEQLVAHKPRLLRDGDEIRLGALVLKVYFR